MSPHAWTEDQLVKQPAIGLFGALGWDGVDAGGSAGRCTLPRTPLLRGAVVGQTVS
jgi:type I restriction enzyme, R subunit